MAETKDPIILDQKAVIYLKSLLDKQNIPSPPGGIRIGIRAGGCHGLSYFWEPCVGHNQDDRVVDLFLIRIFINPKSMTKLEGTHVSYSSDLIQGPLIFNNPNAESSCGCGTSFKPK